MVLFSDCVLLMAILTFLCNLSVNVSAPSNQLSYITRDDDTRLKFNKLLNTIANVNKQRLNALKKYSEINKYKFSSGILRLSDDPVIAVLFINKRYPAANKIYKIYDRDIKNKAGDTPARDIIQQVKDYYNEVVQNDESDDVIPSIENNIIEMLYETKTQPRIERDGKEPSDGEEIITSKTKMQAEENDNGETSDGEEIGSKRGRIIPDKVISQLISNKKGIIDNKEIPSNDTKIDNKQILRLFKSCNKKAARLCKKACKRAYKRVCESYRCSSKMKNSFKRHCKSECKSRFSD